jgi:hypothetical protein
MGDLLSPSRPVTALKPLPGLSTALFTYTNVLPRNASQPASGVDVVRDLLTTENIGVVYEMPRSRPGRAVRACVDQTRRHSPKAPILIDAALYGGKHPKNAQERIDPSWVRLQHSCGLPWALTDSGLVQAGDLGAVETVLQATAGLQGSTGNVIAVLPLADGWVPYAGGIAELVQQYQVPVAFALGHQRDPLSSRGAVDALVQLHSTDVASLHLRIDAGGLGLLAYPCSGVAIGDSTGRRHIFPAHEKDGYGQSHPAAFLPSLIDYFTFDKITRLLQTDPAHPALACGCRYCSAGSLADVLDDPTGWLAARHSIAALADLARRTYPSGSTAEQRQRAWDAAIEAATLTYAGVDVPGWQPKSQMTAWSKRRTPALTT